MLSSTRPPPVGLRWRSSTSYIISTVTIAMFTDLFLYGIIVPTLPFIISSRLHLPQEAIQQRVSLLLAYFGGASVLGSLPAGYIADLLPSRRPSFLFGLSSMFIATALLWLGQSWSVLVIARIFQGISACIVWSVGLAMIIDTVGNRRLAVVLNSIFGTICVGELVAPVVGGVVYQHLGEGWVFYIGFLLLAVDLVMRILVVEKKLVKSNGWEEFLSQNDHVSTSENAPLISSTIMPSTEVTKDFSGDEWRLSSIPGWFTKAPILYLSATCPRLLVSFVLCFTHAMTLATFDATIPIESLDLFSFSSRSAGLMFVPLLLPYLLLSPAAGFLVKRYGTKPLASFGLFFLASSLLLFGKVHSALPGQTDYMAEVTKFALILVGCGIGLAAIGSQSLVDASYVMEKYEKNNPDLFPLGGPYAQLYAMNSMIFSLGLTIGPPVAGLIKVKLGYAVMNYILSAWCIVVSILCALFLGETPRIFKRACIDDDIRS